MGCCRLKPQRIHIYEIDYLLLEQKQNKKNSPFSSDFLDSTISTDVIRNFSSKRVVNDKYFLDGSFNSNKFLDDTNVRISRFNQSAMKMLIRNNDSKNAFWQYLSQCNSLKASKSLWKNQTYRGATWSDMLDCYTNLEDIKFLGNDDQIISRTSALVWKCQTMYESVRIVDGITTAASTSNNGDQSSTMWETPTNLKIVEFALWECMGKLKHIDIMSTSKDALVGYLTAVQESILFSLATLFEEFLRSDSYSDWQINRFRLEKMRRTSNIILGSHNSDDRLPSCSSRYPKVLIVDDSAIVLKLAGLTLEKDGHVVHTASSGEMALSMSSTTRYDVIVIDINMPVYDGCETVQLFRYREEERLEEEEDFDDYEDMEEYFGSSEVSSLSAFSWQPLEEQSFYQKYFKAYQRMAAKELKLKEAKENQQLQGNDPAVVGVSMPVDSTQKNGLEVVGAAVSPFSEPVEDSADVAIHESIVLLNANPGDSNGEVVPAGPSEAKADVPNVVTDSTPPIEAQKQPVRRQLIIGMSDSTDEFTRRKALECGMDSFISKPFSLEKFLEAMLSLPVMRDEPTAPARERKSSTIAGSKIDL